MAALFVHVVEVLMQREKVLYTTLGCWLGGSCFYKVRGNMSSTKISRKNMVALILFQWACNFTYMLDNFDREWIRTGS